MAPSRSPDQASDRPSFPRRLFGIGALVGLSGALFGRSAKRAEAGHSGPADNVFHLGTTVLNRSGPAALRFDSSRPAIIGDNRAANGTGLAGYGTNKGVIGTATGESAVGLEGLASNKDTDRVTFGVRGTAAARTSIGVEGVAIATDATATGIGVSGRSLSRQGVGVLGEAGTLGVHGRAIAPSGLGQGVLGQSNSREGTGVRSPGQPACTRCLVQRRSRSVRRAVRERCRGHCDGSRNGKYGARRGRPVGFCRWIGRIGRGSAARR
jgi:hypothetical protein